MGRIHLSKRTSHSLPCFSKGHNTTLQVRQIEEAKDRLKKANRQRLRSGNASRLPMDAEKAKIRAQMEADRAERASASKSIAK